jgi:molecular chaperone GrpE
VANKKAEEMTEEITEELKEGAEVEENGEKADTPPTQEELLAKIANLEEELAELGDKHLRMAAEYENFRRRSKEEKDATYSVAKADTVGELLPIIDNLERAALYDDGEKVKEGLVMTLKSVESVFAKLGVESVGKVGDIFDPNLHNAVLHDEDPEKSEGEITDVFQKGYRAKDRIIRFAMVKTVN